MDSRNVKVATSREALLERPPPMGTDETITALKPGTLPKTAFKERNIVLLTK